jgi:hypothetical protein
VEKKPVVLCADVGLQWTLLPSDDPIADFLDLMDVVEALCPEWPAPEATTEQVKDGLVQCSLYGGICDRCVGHKKAGA